MEKRKQPPEKNAFLIIASSEKDANLFYATKFLAPDSLIFIQTHHRKILIASDLEIDRAKDEACVSEVLSSSKIQKTLKRNGIAPSTVEIAAHSLKEEGVKFLTVPAYFPIAYADSLRKKGFQIEWKRDPFFEERSIKTKEEIKAIQDALCHTEHAFSAAVDILRKSTIRGKFLIHQGKRLCSEDLRQTIHLKLMEAGCIALRTIVSCYNDCVNPHHPGSGPLLANQSIVIDIFPYSSETRYFADMTRTFVRGKASPQLKKMYAAVKKAQEIAFGQIRSGVDASKIHSAIMEYFEAIGFKTGEINGRLQGFLHGTGHGVGLEVHEPPRISAAKDILKTGQVVTVEPGLYYKNIGGVRLEDLVVVERNSCMNLTKFPKILEV